MSTRYYPHKCGKTYEYQFDERGRFKTVPYSKRQKVFRFLMQHPNASNKLLYSLFDGTTNILKYVVKRYKCQFFKKYPWLRSNSNQKYTIQDREDESLSQIQAMIKVYEQQKTRNIEIMYFSNY